MTINDKISSVVRETAAQVTAMLTQAGAYPMPRLVAMDEVTLRVHRRVGSTVYNTDVRYDRGPDTYTVTRHRLRNHGLDVESQEPVEGVYCDMLADVILRPWKDGAR